MYFNRPFIIAVNMTLAATVSGMFAIVVKMVWPLATLFIISIVIGTFLVCIHNDSGK